MRLTTRAYKCARPGADAGRRGVPAPRRARALLASALAVALLAVSAPARQQQAGSIRGVVKDQLESLVVGATVTANGVGGAAGASATAVTDSAGAYELKNLRPGSYDLTVSAPGFALFERRGVAVRPGRASALDVQLEVALEEEAVTVEDTGVSTDSERNADALVLRGRDLEALPTDPQALTTALQALAGPPGEGQPGGAQITVDGFSGGQVPPKEAIREVRVNQNPFSAEYEYPGWGGIEIYTQPGADKWRGGASFDFNDESLNSRNPFAPVRAPYQQRGYHVNLSGPVVPKRASFSFYVGRYESDNNSVVNATVLDAVTLAPVAFRRSFVTPQVSTYGTLRGDLKINKRHTLVGNYRYGRSTQDLQGIGGFALPSRAFGMRRSDHTLQLTETAVLNETTINETRLQIVHNSWRQTGDASLPALNVLDSFFGGGSQVGAASNRQDRYELQNFTSWTAGNHYVKIGGRVRGAGLESVSPANFGGTYTFAGGLAPALDDSGGIVLGADGQPELIQISSLERYRRTLLFTRSGLSPAEVRALGGGPTQFSIAAGEPRVRLRQTDVGLYVQDEWKLRPNLTISPGLRYENQTNVSSNWNFAPRIAFAWAPTFGRSKKAEPKTAEPKAPAPAATQNSTTQNTPTQSATPTATAQNTTSAATQGTTPRATTQNTATPAASTQTATTPSTTPSTTQGTTQATTPSAAQGTTQGTTPSAARGTATPAATTQTAATPTAATPTASTQTAAAQGAARPAAPPAAPPAPPKTVIRGGVGIFYNRISEDVTLQSLRFNGTNQQQFVVTDSAVLDLRPFDETEPAAPAAELLAFAQPQTRRAVAPYLDPSHSIRFSLSVERQLPHNLKVTLGFNHSRLSHSLRVVNVNAPLAGTFDAEQPTSAVRPLGVAAGNVFEYQSNGRSVHSSMSVSVNGRVGKANVWGAYTLARNRNTDGGASGSPFDPYDFNSEWGRSPFDIRHFFYAGGNVATPLGFNLNFFAVGNSGTPFNIITGRDTNGDTIFAERPAFATDLSKPGVVVTPIGAFDPNPAPGQALIPRNFGQGPSFLSVNMGLERAVKFGRAIQPAATGPAQTVSGSAPAPAASGGAAQKPPPKPPVQRPYQMTFSVYAVNLINRTNSGNPVGNLASPFFLRSNSASTFFIFGPGGGGAAGNRQLMLRVRFSF
jgi:Carboxypeptidase regulatory-like domain/TonB dependent receptor